MAKITRELGPYSLFIINFNDYIQRITDRFKASGLGINVKYLPLSIAENMETPYILDINGRGWYGPEGIECFFASVDNCDYAQ